MDYKSSWRIPVLLNSPKSIGILTLCLYAASAAVEQYLPSAIFQAVKIISGIPVIFFIPAIFFMELRLKEGEAGVFDFLARSFALNLPLLLLLTTVIKLLLGPLTALNFHLGIVILSVAAILAGIVLRRAAILKNDLGALPPMIVAGWLIIIIFLFTTARPLLPTGDDIWPDTTWGDFSRLDFKVIPGIEKGEVKGLPPEGVEKVGPVFYRIISKSIDFSYYNRTAQPQKLDLKYSLQNFEDFEVEAAVSSGGKSFVAGTIPPKFDVKRHPRNFNSNNVFLSLPVVINPGENYLRISFSPKDQADSKPQRIVVGDFSNLGRAEFIKLFRQRYLIGDKGDIRENILLPESVIEHFFVRTNSYNGSEYDGGGYSYLDPLKHFQAGFTMVLLGGDRAKALGYLYIAYLLAMLLVLAKTIRFCSCSDRRSWLAVAVPLIAVLGYSKIVRFGVESFAVDTFFTLAFLLCAYFLLGKKDSLFLVFGLYAFLARHQGILILILALMAYGLVLGERKRGIKLLALYCGIVAAGAIVFLLSISAAGGLDNSFTILAGENKSRFRLFTRIIIDGDISDLFFFAGRIFDFLKYSLLATLLLPISWALAKDRKSLFFISIALVYGALIAVSDELRAHYVAPIIGLAAIGSALGLLSINDKKRFAAWTSFVILMSTVSLAYLTGRTSDYTRTFDPSPVTAYVHPNVAGRYHYFKGVQLLALNESMAAREEFKKSGLVAPAGLAWVHAALAKAYYAEGLYDEALAEARKGLSANKGNWEARFIISRSYKRKGLIDKAARESAQGLILDPGNIELKFLHASTYFEKGRSQQAEKIYLDIIGINPSSAEAYKNLAVLYYGPLNKPEAALYHFRKSLDIDPKQEEAANIKQIVDGLKSALGRP